MMLNESEMHSTLMMGLDMVWIVVGLILTLFVLAWISVRVLLSSDKERKNKTPNEILLERLDRGEIDGAEFKELLKKVGE